jgi:hypothetical protein
MGVQASEFPFTIGNVKQVVYVFFYVYIILMLTSLFSEFGHNNVHLLHFLIFSLIMSLKAHAIEIYTLLLMYFWFAIISF